MQWLRLLVGATSLLFAGCATTNLATQEFRLHGVELDAPMTAVELQRAVPGMSCLGRDTDGVETCVMLSDDDAPREEFSVSLFEGRVGSIVVLVGLDEFETLARRVVSQLGDGVEVRGEAGVEGRQDQVVLTWAQDRRFVRLVKREPFDLSKSVLIALSRAMDAHLETKPQRGTTPGRCRTYALACPGV